MLEKLKDLWRRSQVKAAAAIHALAGAAVVIAGTFNAPEIKGLLPQVLSTQMLGYVALASAVVIYLAAPHEGK